MYQNTTEPTRTTEDKMKDIKIMLDKFKKSRAKINIYTKNGSYFNITYFKFSVNKRILFTAVANISIRQIIRIEEVKNE